MKINIIAGYFDEAIQIGQSIVAEHPLVTTRFTSNQNKPKTNLMHDLSAIVLKQKWIYQIPRVDVCCIILKI